MKGGLLIVATSLLVHSHTSHHISRTIELFPGTEKTENVNDSSPEEHMKHLAGQV